MRRIHIRKLRGKEKEGGVRGGRLTIYGAMKMGVYASRGASLFWEKEEISRTEKLMLIVAEKV